MRRLFSTGITDQITAKAYADDKDGPLLILQFENCTRHQAITLATEAYNAIKSTEQEPDTLEKPVIRGNNPFQASLAFDTEEAAEQAGDQALGTFLDISDEVRTKGLENVLPEYPHLIDPPSSTGHRFSRN